MKFELERASTRFQYSEKFDPVEINSLEELTSFIEKWNEDIIIRRIPKWDQCLSKYKIIIYDDYVE